MSQEPFDDEKREMGEIEFEEEAEIFAGQSMWMYEGKYIIEVRPGTRVKLITQRMSDDGMYEEEE